MFNILEPGEECLSELKGSDSIDDLRLSVRIERLLGGVDEELRQRSDLLFGRVEREKFQPKFLVSVLILLLHFDY